MSIRTRLEKLEGRDGPNTEETLLVTTGVPHDDVDDGTGPTVARVRGEWIPRDLGEPTADFLARVAALSQRRTA